MNDDLYSVLERAIADIDEATRLTEENTARVIAETHRIDLVTRLLNVVLVGVTVVLVVMVWRLLVAIVAS